nr:uncharacterized protein LOC105341179 [Crassostrea gigas]
MNTWIILMKIFCLSTYVVILAAKLCTLPGGVLLCCPGFVWNRIENRCLKWKGNALMPSGDSPTLREQSTFPKSINGILSTVSLDLPEDFTVTSSYFSYKWIFVTIVLLCFIIEIISGTVIFKQLRRRQETVSTDDANYTPMQQDDIAHDYNLIDENLHPNMESRRNGSNQVEKFPSYT